MHVRPLSSLTREEVTALAVTAADNAEPVSQANPFPRGCWQHFAFKVVHGARMAELLAA